MAYCQGNNGIAFIKLGDVTIEFDDNDEVEVFAVPFTREALAVGGFKETKKQPYISLTISPSRLQSVQALQGMCDVPITVQKKDGRTFHGEHASNTSGENYMTTENKLKMEFTMPIMIEQFYN